MIRLKKGVNLSGLTTQALLAMMVVEGLYREQDRVLWITSVNDGKHSEKSLHHAGNAFDCRVWNIDSPKEMADLIKDALGKDYDVVYEVNERKPEHSHIHVEYQPRQKGGTA